MTAEYNCEWAVLGKMTVCDPRTRSLHEHRSLHLRTVYICMSLAVQAQPLDHRLEMACAGITRVGKRCQITSTSAMADSNGRLVAGPLRRGSPYCLFHSRPFTHFPANTSGPLVLLLLDLETTGTEQKCPKSNNKTVSK